MRTWRDYRGAGCDEFRPDGWSDLLGGPRRAAGPSRGDSMATTSTWLWFDNEGEEAAAFYTSVLPNSRILGKTRYSAAMPERAGQVMTVEFELDGKPYLALNAGPQFEFTEAISIQINCDTQEEVDEYW